MHYYICSSSHQLCFCPFSLGNWTETGVLTSDSSRCHSCTSDSSRGLLAPNNSAVLCISIVFHCGNRPDQACSTPVKQEQAIGF